MRIDKRVSEHEALGRDSAINQGVTVPGREGACPTCGRMFDCCCEVGEVEGSEAVQRIKDVMGVRGRLNWQALRTLQEEVRR